MKITLREIGVVAFALLIGAFIWTLPLWLGPELGATAPEAHQSLASGFLAPLAAGIPVLIMVAMLSPPPIDDGGGNTPKRRPSEAASLFTNLHGGLWAEL
ncbi:MAG TPA: hypothetical protein VN495_01375 [Candidatus Paceibacterota bacterium]|nr:hypothetical protein [Candidatus Paceibacterota bacterium]